jgi:hypothetical protein
MIGVTHHLNQHTNLLCSLGTCKVVVKNDQLGRRRCSRGRGSRIRDLGDVLTTIDFPGN